MATSTQEISAFLNEDDIKHKVVEESNRILTGYRTHTYRDSDGDDGIRIVIYVKEKGEYIEIAAPNCYACPDIENRPAALQACLMVCWMTKAVQFEFDASDGEIRAVIEVPLEDALLTKRQLKRCIHNLISVVEEYDPMIRKAITTGEIEVPKRENREELMEAFQAFLAERRRQQQSGSTDSDGADIDLED